MLSWITGARSAKTSEQQRWVALIVLCVGMLMIVLDATIVNVALPSIQGELGFSQSSLAWVVNAYLIAFGGLLLLAGRLGDLLGRRHIFMGGLAVLAVRLLDRDEGIGLGRGADLIGALLIVSALMLGVYTIVEASNYGWGSAHTLGFGAPALALLAGFILREARTPNPLIPLHIFRARNTSGANLIQTLMVAGMFGMFFLGALYLQ